MDTMAIIGHIAHSENVSEPCLHVWQYYDRKVSDRRRKRLPCNRLEDKAMEYSLRAAGLW